MHWRSRISLSPVRRPRSGLARLERILAALGLTWLVFVIRNRQARTHSQSIPNAIPPETAPPVEPDPDAGDHGLYKKVPAPKRWEQDKESGRQRFKRWLLGRERVPLPSYTRLIEEPPAKGERPKTGICCSGGGIRSAAFNLGALQELQAANRLHDAKYLAAVSGGSYIAAAFSMVAKTPEPGDTDSDDSEPDLFKSDTPPFYHGSPEEQYLRNRSSYLAPGGSGRARLVLRVALGLFVNLALLTAGLVLLAWLLALYYRLVHEPLQKSSGIEAGVETLEVRIVVGIAAVALALGVVSIFLRATADRSRRALETLTLYGLGLAGLVLLVTIALPELVAFLRSQGIGRVPSQVTSEEAQASVAGAAGGGFGALLLAVLVELRSSVTVEEAKKAAKWYQRLAAPVRRAVTRFAAWMVGPLLLVAILVFVLVAMVSAQHITPEGIAGVAVGFAIFCLFSDITSWSLHPFYRRRLCTAFALKRVKGKGSHAPAVALERKYYKLVPLSKSGVTPGPGRFKTWPTLVVCAAANVSDPAATPPGRSVTSFTFSPVAMGGPLIGGVPTGKFEDNIARPRRRDFTLPAAVAMSGAAISPSMGKETRPSIRFLLGLANVRLGVWVPNPRRTKSWIESSMGIRTNLDRFANIVAKAGAPERSGAHTKRFLFPRPGPWYLVKEMLGWNSVNDKYVYVTDGGHYENLGLVELLRRGCTDIFCFDASGGKRLDALGDAIALARSELGVEIEIDPEPVSEDTDTRLAKQSCATGRIAYPGGQPGVLTYVRTVVTKDVPYDVLAFLLRDEAFPHHATMDQLYTDEKFEAYRELGAHASRAALKEAEKACREELGYSRTAVVAAV